MPVEACNDLSAAGLIAACGGQAARDGRPTEENRLPHHLPALNSAPMGLVPAIHVRPDAAFIAGISVLRPDVDPRDKPGDDHFIKPSYWKI